MIIRYDIDEFNVGNSSDLFDLECCECCKIFKKKKTTIIYEQKRETEKVGRLKFCSAKCSTKNQTRQVECVCENCGEKFTRKKSDLKYDKTFCSNSCSATYYNFHGINIGRRRSVAEEQIEGILNDKYNIDILYNDKTTIQSELDIYIPSLKMAFELNGIYHYRPVRGDNKVEKYNRTVLNDQNKVTRCIEMGISLFVIDMYTNKNKKFNEYVLDICNEIDIEIQKRNINNI